MTETSRRWNSLMEFIKGKTRSVMVFEPSQEDLDSFCEELRLAGHVVHGYSAIAQIEAGELPYIVDYVFFNTSFGQVEKPTESWSVSQFLNAFSIRVDENHILTYYSESIKPEISTAMKTVREALKYDPLQ